MLTQEIKDTWEDNVKELWKNNKERVKRGLLLEFGEYYKEEKLQNFCDIGSMPMSVLAFHNNFLRHCRNAFIVGAYYPALTGACALGERILNHLLLLLRNEFKNTPQYKEVYKKHSFDNWTRSIEILYSWGVLLEDVASTYKELSELRNRSIHFNHETDTNDRALALEAIQLLQKIIGEQFAAFGAQPWFIGTIPGEAYIKKEWESDPFIKGVFLPNCQLVGPKHSLTMENNSWIVHDASDYDDTEINDEEFSRLRTGKNNK